MTRILLAFCALALLAGCGIKRPLLRPNQIPAYEEKQRRKLQQLEDDPDLTPAAAPGAASPETPAPGGDDGTR